MTPPFRPGLLTPSSYPALAAAVLRDYANVNVMGWRGTSSGWLGFNLVAARPQVIAPGGAKLHAARLAKTIEKGSAHPGARPRAARAGGR